MSFLVYLAVLIAALCSVVMGLDWATSPPAPATATVQTRAVEPVRHPAAAENPAPAKVAPRRQAAAPPARPIEDQTVAQSPPNEEASSPTAPAPSCNVRACSAAYQSFRAEDCTYQPYSGPRRACTK
jgi:hypothetical protein